MQQESLHMQALLLLLKRLGKSKVHPTFVHMAFSDGKLVYADAVHSLKRGRSIVTLKMMSVNLFDRVPRHAQKMGCVF